MKVRAILNPRAGLRARGALESVSRSVPSRRELEVRVTEHAGHARELAAEAARTGFDLVLAVGGDGTANETAWGLLGSETVFGLVPVGSGNGLARGLGIPLRPAAALAALEAAVERRMDVLRANGRPVLNVAGAGFDAEVGAEFHAHGLRGGRRGVLPYVFFGARRLLTRPARSWSLAAGEFRFEGRAQVVAFANGRQYGGAAVIAPGSRLDDGLMDVVVIEDAPRLVLLLNAVRLFVGGLEGFRRYRRRPVAAAVLEGPAPFDFHRDGEPEARVARLEVTLDPRALRVLVPRATAEDPDGPFLPA